MRFSATTVGFTVSAVAAATIGLVLLGGSGHGAPGAGAAAQTAAMPVPVASVIRRSVPVYLDYIGTTEAIRTVTLQAQVTGYLAARGAPDGADVKQGELLYQIDPRDYQAALDQVKAQAQHDAAAHDYSRVSQSRNSVLSKDGWVAKDTFDQTTSNFHQSQATLAADAAAIQTAELKLGYTEIRAPFDGRLGKSLVHEGALINAAGTQFNTLVELDPIYVTFNPSETELAAIAKARLEGPDPVDVQTSDDAQPRVTAARSPSSTTRSIGAPERSRRARPSPIRTIRCCLASSFMCMSTSPTSPTRCWCHRSRWVQASSAGSFTSSARTARPNNASSRPAPAMAASLS